MRKIHINLPPKYRLTVQLTKSRELDVAPLVPNLGKILRAKKGSKFSRFFIHIFEHKKARKVLPIYFTIVIGISAYMPFILSSRQVSAAELVPTPAYTQPVIQTLQGTRYPVEKIVITQKYGFFHPGLDLDGVTGDSIYPMMAGNVEIVEKSKIGFGLSIVINHGNGFSSRYAHLSKTEVSEGQAVDINTEIGKMGATGHASGDHLHFEVYEYGKTINPMSVLPK